MTHEELVDLAAAMAKAIKDGAGVPWMPKGRRNEIASALEQLMADETLLADYMYELYKYQHIEGFEDPAVYVTSGQVARIKEKGFRGLTDNVLIAIASSCNALSGLYCDLLEKVE